MPLDSAPVRQWLDSVAPGIAISQIANQAGISRITLHQQLRRGHVPEASVIAIARSLGRSPLEVLASFEEYSDLVPAEPAVAEAHAFIDWPELLVAVGRLYRGSEISEEDLGEHIFVDGSRVWVDAIDPGSLRKQVCEAEGITSSNLAASLRGVLKAPLAVSFARLAGTPIASALVVSGALTPIEAGWRSDARSQALRARPMPELLAVVEARISAAQKFEKRVHAFKEGLG